MTINFKAGDVVKANRSYIEEVLTKVLVPDPTHFQTVQSLSCLRDETARVRSIGHISIEGVFYTWVNLTPTSNTNVLFRHGKGTNIYFVSEEYLNKSLLRV